MAAGKCYDIASELLSRLFSSAAQSLWIATAFLDSCGVSLIRKAISRGWCEATNIERGRPRCSKGS